MDTDSINNKRPLLLFSGGLDSTYELSQLLKTTDVDILYVESCQGQDKINGELKAINDIREYLETNIEKYPYKIINFYKEKVDIPNINEVAFHQPILWLNAAIAIVSNSSHSNVVICYVSGDQISSKLFNIEQAYNYLCSFTKHETIPLWFPLQNISKLAILNNIDPELLKRIWVCEFPIHNVQCKSRCVSCINLESQKYQLKKYLLEINQNDEFKLSTDLYSDNRYRQNYLQSLITINNHIP